MKAKKLIAALMALGTVVTVTACAQAPDPVPPGSTDAVIENGVASGTQNVVVLGEAWGPVVAKTVVTLNVTVDSATVTPENFLVEEVKGTAAFSAVNGSDPTEKTDTVAAKRTVTDAYTCDAKGNRVDGASSMICLELDYNAKEGSAFLYSFQTRTNIWLNPYELHLKIAENAGLATVNGVAITGLDVPPEIDLTQAMIPQLEGVDLSGTFTGTDGKTLQYGSYAPAADGKQHALVIWLHGAGEGSAGGAAGPEIVNLGNQVSALYTMEFQSLFGGAYVLTPQCPTFWMQYDETGAWNGNPGVPSVYTATLMELIDSYVKANPGIDPNRIIIGGCSNGGYMTMNMLLTYPNYFAAAYPICEAYKDEGITDGQIESIKHIPMWFIYALNDVTVNPNTYEIPTINRLKAAGADVTVSEYEDVGEYLGHWSWIYFFHNDCVAQDGTTVWQWMAQQTK